MTNTDMGQAIQPIDKTKIAFINNLFIANKKFIYGKIQPDYTGHAACFP